MKIATQLIREADLFAITSGRAIHRTVRDIADHIDAGDDSADAYDLLRAVQRLLCNVHGTRA